MIKNKSGKVLMLLLIAISSMVVVTFAYFSQVFSGWEHTISSTSLTFLFNRHTFGDTITKENLNLSRGEEADLDLLVEVTSNQKNVKLGYSITLTLDDGADNGLAPAIECYMLEKGVYRFIGMLNDITGYDGEAATPDAGYVIKGYLPASFSYAYSMKFVYSPGAGVEYENKSFNVTASAQIEELNFDDFNYVFAHDIKTLNSAVSLASNANKTVYLLGNIELTDNLIVSVPVSIDLKGFEIRARNGSNPKLVVRETTAAGSAFTGHGIYSSAASAGGVEIPIEINLPNGFYAIDCPVSGNDVTFTDFSVKEAANYIQKTIDTYENVIFKTGDAYEAFVGVGLYIKAGGLKIEAPSHLFGAAGGTFEIVPVSQSGKEVVILTIDYGTYAFTVGLETEFKLTKLSGSAGEAYAGGLTVVRGNGLEAIAESLMKNIPDRIVGSILLPAKDQVTGANITWIIPNEYHSYLDTNGTFLRDGYEKLLNWEDVTIEIGVKVSLNGEQASYYSVKIVSVADSLTAEKRTALIYSNRQIVLQTETKNFSLLEEINELLKISGLVSIETPAAAFGAIANSDYLKLEEVIGIANPNAGNDGEPDFLYYKYSDLSDAQKNLLMESGGVKCFTLTVVKIPQKAFINIDNVKITFNYELSNGTKISCEIIKNITVLGVIAEYEVNDSASFIQAEFDSNDYISNIGKSFYVSGNVKSGVLVEFIVDKEFENFISVRNDVYLPVKSVESGGIYFVKIAEDDLGGVSVNANGSAYAFFNGNSRYDEMDSEDISSDGRFVDLVLYDGSVKKYMRVNIDDLIAQGNLYVRKALITILYEYVPPYNLTAIIRAKLYTLISVGEDAHGENNRVYKYDVEGNQIQYKFTLAIKGIYHFKPTEIADYNVYLALLKCYDRSGNGYIECDEALLEPLTAGLTLYSPHYAINLSNKNIETIKGVEYFPKIPGFNLSNNSKFSDLSYLASLSELKYLDLSYGSVADLRPLMYLDNLIHLNLLQNSVTTLQPIQYLPNIQILYIGYNPNISDFSYISGYKKLTYLYAVQAVGDYTNTTDSMYYFALIAANNPYAALYITGVNVWPFTTDEKAAAKAMSEFIVATQVATVIYAPAQYSYGGNDYRLEWYTESFEKIQFVYENGAYRGDIISPIVQESVKISLRVYRRNPSSGEYEWVKNISRSEILTLLPSAAAEDSYIETAPGVFARAETVVPDAILLSKLFAAFNKNTSDTVPAGSPVSEKYLLSWSELNPATKTEYMFDWSGSGIKNLTGIEVFANLFSIANSTINLTNNSISDLSPLRALTSLKVLILGGQRYDFSQLVTYSVDAEGYFDKTVAAGGLIGLTSLYVYGAYDLSEYVMLKDLFAVYLCNNFKGGTLGSTFSIYLVNSTTKWAPLTSAMEKEAQKLPNTYSVKDLGIIYLLADQGRNLDAVVYDLWKLDIVISSIASVSTPPQADSAGSSASGYFTTAYSPSAYISYNKLVGFTQTFFTTVTLNGGGTTLSYYIQIAVNVNDNIILEGVDSSSKYYNDSTYVTSGGKSGIPLTQIFSGRSLLASVMAQMTAARIGTPTADGYYFISQANLRAWVTGATVSSIANTLLVDGSYISETYLGTLSNGDRRLSIDGLELTGIKALYFVRDAVFGDGRSLINIETIVSGKGADFTTLEVELPALKHIYIGISTTYTRGAYVNSVFAANSLGYMPELITLALNISQTATGIDWGFLEAIASKASNKISTLYLIADDAGQLASNATLTIINGIYEKSTATTKNFTVAGVPFSPSVSETDLYVIGAAKEYAEFVSLIYDLGVKSDAGYYVATNKQSYSVNEKIYLPYSTYSVGLGITVEDNTILNRAFLINWRIYGVFDQTTFNLLFTCSGATVTFTGQYAQLTPLDTATHDGYITLTCKAADYYTLIRGEIGTGYFELEGNTYKLTTASRVFTVGTAYRFLYPAYVYTSSSTNAAISGGVSSKVGATYFSYSMFTDPTFRLYMFMATLFSGGIGSNTVAAGYGSGYKGAQPNNIASINFSAPTGTSFTFTAFNVNNSNATVSPFTAANLNTINNLPSYVYSFEGIENFTGLRSLTHTGGLLSKLPNLSGTQIQTVSLYNNLIKNLDAFAGCTSLTSLDVNTNPLADISGIVTATSLSTLTMHTCPALTVDLLEPLRGNRSITSLSVYNCPGLAKLETLKILNSMTALSTFRLNSSSTAAAKSDINTFLTALDSANIKNALENGIYVGDLGNTIISGVGNVTAYVDTNVADSSTKFFFPNNSEVPLIVTNAGQILIKLTVKILNESSVTYTMNGYTAENFDPILWAYFAKNYSKGTNEFTVPATLTITANIGLTSLRGLELLSLTSVVVALNPLEELWAGEMPSLITLYLHNTALSTETVYRALRLAPNIKSLNLRGVAGIDYYKEFGDWTFKGVLYVGGSIASTTFSKLTGATAATGFNFDPTPFMENQNIHSWDEYLTKLFDGTLLLEYNLPSTAISNYNISVPTTSTPTVYTTSKTIHSVTSANAIFKYYTITNLSYMRFSYTVYYYYNTTGGATYSSVIYTVLSATQRLYSANIATLASIAREIFPGHTVSGSTTTVALSYDVILANKGILKFNLPSSISMYRTDSIIYTILFGSTGVPVSIISTTGEFYMNLYSDTGGNYYIRDLAGNISQPITIIDNTFTFTIQAQSNFFTNTSSKISLVFQIKNISTGIVYDYNYYIELEEGNFELASKYIKSMGFLYYMYEASAMRNLYVTTTVTEDGTIRPNTITAAKRTAVTTTTISPGSTGYTNYQIASLEGIELFTGIRTLYLGLDSAVTSLEPLRNLSLTSFRNYQSYYATVLGSNYYSNVPVMDYSPIYDGNSRTTMTSMYLSYYTNTAFSDVSFLLNMPALTSVLLYNSTSGTTGNSYFTSTPSFRYVRATLQNRGITLTLTSSPTITEPTAAELISSNIISQLPSTSSLSYADNFKLVINSAAKNEDGTYSLPGMINHNGKIAILEWRDAYGYATVDKYTSNLSKLSSNNVYQTVLTRSYTSSTVKLPNGNPRKFDAGLNLLTYDELMQLTQEAGFISMCASGEVDISIKVSFDLVRAINKNNIATLVVRALIDGVGAERMLTVVER